MKLKELKTIIGENGEQYTLAYSVVESDYCVNNDKIKAYGIRVEKFSGNNLLECKEFKNITSKSIEIKRLFMLLSEHTVTPITLSDVLEDYLA